eukprot:g6788.t1
MTLSIYTLPCLLFILHYSLAIPDGETVPKIRRPNLDEEVVEEACLSDGIFFKQMMAGVDFANPLKAKNTFEQQSFRFAAQMKNYVYLIGDLATGECVVVDGAWDVKGIKRYAKKHGCYIRHFVATHYHYDHIGGSVEHEPFKSRNIRLPGLREFVLGIKQKNRDKRLKNYSYPLIARPYISEVELEEAAKRTGVPAIFFTPLKDFSTLRIGQSIKLTFRHTPGHSPGSMVVLVSLTNRSKDDTDNIKNKNGDEYLYMLSGDTLFPGSCGRVDLVESDPYEMWKSLQTIKTSYDDDLLIFPGHGYNSGNTTIGIERRVGLLGITKEQWLSGRKKRKIKNINLYKEKK